MSPTELTINLLFTFWESANNSLINIMSATESIINSLFTLWESANDLLINIMSATELIINLLFTLWESAKDLLRHIMNPTDFLLKYIMNYYFTIYFLRKRKGFINWFEKAQRFYQQILWALEKTQRVY